MKIGNLFTDAEAPPAGERFQNLLAHRNLVIERIVSAATTPPTQYVQSHDEWVVLLRGEAILEVAHEVIKLRPGDYLFLPGGTPHVVRSASAGALWLAVHLHPRPGGGL
jgi:cupin 2 domain-containing protein